jgi:2,3-dihydroxybiphenyl 1,2-dioxygenase
MSSVFGKVRMGYVVVDSNKLPAWKSFAADALGLHVDQPHPDVLAFRMDDHARRLIVKSGNAEDVVASGWQVDDEATLAEIVRRAKNDGLEVTSGSREEADLRGVETFVAFTGPKRMPIELFIRPVKTAAALDLKVSGFVTGDIGMGHLAITSKKPKAMFEFWKKYFDARLTDVIEARISGINLNIEFLHINARHHSIAVAATRGLPMDPFRTRIQHMNLEVTALEDVTNAYVRCRKLGFKIAMGVGLHTNDKDLSFYVVSPSGFQIEFGWNPVLIDDESMWKPVVYQGISLWGHQPKDQTVGDKLKEMRYAVGSLFRNEFTVP